MRHTRIRCTAVMCSVVFLVLLFFTLNTSTASAAINDHIVSGKTPQGTVISLFDYWVNQQDSPDHGNSNNNSDGGINKDHDLKFSNGNGYSGFNNWTGSSAPYSGMVMNTLNSNGYPFLATDWWSGIFYTSPLDYLFDNSEVTGKKAYSNVDGLIQTDDDGYYYYDCRKNFASYDEKTNKINLYDKPAVKASGYGTTGQFFPFNSATDVFDESNGSLVAKSNVTADSNSVNHWFGLFMSTHFMHPENGKTSRGKDITYEFSGDDDVWVFIDDVLIGDLGGIHDAASLKINFSTGAVTVNGSSDGTLKSKFDAAGKTSSTQWKGNTFSGGTYHTLKFFYLERGNYASNMSLKFNLKLMPDNEAQKVDQYSNELAGATFDLYEADRKEKDGDIEYTAKGSSLCSGTTDVNGSLKLKGSDGATINFEELYKNDIGPYYIMKETDPPAGYRKAKDVWLEYDPKTGAVTTENMWESGIHANPRIMITAPTYLYDRNGNRLEMNSDGSLKRGSIFAVVYKRNDMDGSIGDDNNWSAISGSILDGWKLHEVDSIEDALQGKKYELKLNSMGAYETTLDELPGDIMTYSTVIVADNAGKSDQEILKALQDKSMYSISYYYTTGDIDDATSQNSVRLDMGIMSSNTIAREFEYQYAVKLVATDVSDDLYVKKFDKYTTDFSDSEHTVNGVKFALYPEDQTTLLSRMTPGDVVLKDDAVPVQEQTTADISSSYDSMDLSGTAIFRKLTNGTYYLKEVSAPSGYKINDKLIKVIVNDNGAFADAGEKGDGIYVGRGGSGTLLKSMEQFATNDDIDSTLTNMQISLKVSDKEPGTDGSWDESSVTTKDPIHVRYTALGEASHVGHYKILNEDGSSDQLLQHIDSFATDTGWPYISLKQCREHNADSNTTTKTDLGDMELSHLLVLESMVMVTDETVGDLEISKKVVNNISDSTFDDDGFDFDVRLYETVKDDEEKETEKPVSGDFTYTLKGSGMESSEHTITFDKDGKAKVTLKDGQSITLKDLPASAKYDVTESAADHWSVSSSVDGADYTDSITVKGTVPEPDENGSKQKSTVAYSNTYEPSPASLSIPVEKRFNAWNDQGFMTEYFDIRLTAIENTGNGDINDTMTPKKDNFEEVAKDDDGRMTDTLKVRRDSDSAAPDNEGYVHSSDEFQKLKFTHTGTYVYTVKEIIGSISDIRYSAAVFDVAVTVTDDGKGNLSASYEITQETDDNGNEIDKADSDTSSNAIFTNTYSNHYGYMDLRVHKTYENETGSDALTQDQFRFRLEAAGDNKATAPMPGDTTDRSVTAGNTIGGSVSFPAFVFQTNDIGKQYIYKLTEVIPDEASAENDHTVNGTKYDPSEFFIRISVTSNGETSLNTEIEYFEDENCTIPITKDSDHMYEIENGVYRLHFNNSYSAEPASVVIRGSKTLNGRDMKAGEFTFRMVAADDETRSAIKNGSISLGSDDTDSLEAAVSAAADGKASGFSFDRMTFTKAGTYRFSVTEKIPADAEGGVLDGVTYDDNISTVTVKVSDRDAEGSKTGKLTTAVSYDNSQHTDISDLAGFTNTYEATGSADISGSKKITGRDFANGDSFTFTVTPEGSAPYPVDKDGNEVKELTVTPASGRTADLDFGTVNFDKTDVTYRYTLKEKLPDGSNEKDGIKYDSTSYVLTLTSRASDPEDGRLTVERSLTADGENAENIVWTNEYSAAGSMAMKGTKTLSGRKWNDNDAFTFTLWAKADDKALLDAVTNSYEIGGDRAVFGSITVDSKDAGSGKTAELDFGSIGFTKASDGSPYEFYISEEVPAKAEHLGIIYDSEPHRIPVYVTDDGKGKLSAAVADNSKTNLDFYNTYSSSVIYSSKAGIVISKTLTGHDMTDSQFGFTLKALDNKEGGTTASEAAYKFGFDREATEKTYNSPAAADGTIGTIDVLDGISVKYTHEDAGLTYRYEVSESKGGGKGYTNDSSVYIVDVAVSDNSQGIVTVRTTVTDKASGKTISSTKISSTDDDKDRKIAEVPFRNSYEAAGSLNAEGTACIEAEKKLSGRDMKAGEFTFNVFNAKDTSEKAAAVSTGTAGAAADGSAGKISFSEIKYTTDQLNEDVQKGLAAKTDSGSWVYQYVVAEETSDLPSGVSAVASSFTVTVTVTDNGDGTLKADVSYPDDMKKLRFENAYDTAKAVIPIKGVKVLGLSDDDLQLSPADIAGKFEFSITGTETTASGTVIDAPAPVLNGKEVTKTVNDAAGEVDFGRISFEASDFENMAPDDNGIRSRRFTYTITESGSVPGVENDSDVTRTLTVTVSYNSEKHVFSIEGMPEGSAFTFTNRYSVKPVTVDADTVLKVSKILTGRDLKKGEFSFELAEISGDSIKVISKGTNEAAAAGEKADVTFDKLTYSRPGEHDYQIREIIPTGGKDKNITFDGRVFSIHVSVTDNKDGTLSVTGSTSGDKPAVFRNKYSNKPDKPVTPPDNNDKDDDNNRRTKTGDDMHAGIFILLMAAAGAVAVTTLSRRKRY